MTAAERHALVVAALADLLRTVDDDERARLQAFLRTNPTLGEVRRVIGRRLALLEPAKARPDA